MKRKENAMSNDMLREGELELINKLSRRELKAEEIYVFTVTLCDNDIDRDFERFSDSALERLAELFVGKTGICDHDAKSGNQKARIFNCYTEKTGERTQDGREYMRLCGRAYMLRTDSNEELIAEIEAGIKKEVSVGCSMRTHACSVCGRARSDGCLHKNGRYYKTNLGKTLCHTVLSEPTDAYEWSFVAVPAQRRAGVTKSYKENKKMTENEMIKAFCEGTDISVTETDSEKLKKYLAEQNGLCELGRAYLAEKRAVILQSPIFAEIGINGEVLKAVLNRMTISELDEFYRAAKEKSLVPVPQLKPENTSGNDNFKI